jgi:hypothetical protein
VGSFKTGQIVWAYWPGKRSRRRVIVLKHYPGGKVALIYITTQVHQAGRKYCEDPIEVRKGSPEMKAMGLSEDSLICCDQILLLDVSLIQILVGCSVPENLMQRILSYPRVKGYLN